MLNAKEYIEKGAGSCPSCGSTSIDGDGVEVEGARAFQSCACHECEKEWTDIYSLVGFSHGDDGEEVIEDPKSRISSLEERVHILREAAKDVIDAWHGRDLAGAVGKLVAVLEATKEGA